MSGKLQSPVISSQRTHRYQGGFYRKLDEPHSRSEHCATPQTEITIQFAQSLKERAVPKHFGNNMAKSNALLQKRQSITKIGSSTNLQFI
jgi:hypothetical protein